MFAMIGGNVRQCRHRRLCIAKVLNKLIAFP
jgi:hypothetical protein